MMDIKQNNLRIAVLIDSDNISSRYASNIFNELETYGFASCRRIYGNWSKSNGWSEEILLENSINPIQQFNYTTGKNSTDMTMVIDAMDILYSGNVDCFCLVTSDSDFTRLAMRLREANMYVIGMGESKTPTALTKACNKFIHLNLIYEQPASPVSEYEYVFPDDPDLSDFSQEYSLSHDATTVTSIGDIEEAIISIINNNENKGKITYMSEVGNRLNSKFTDFDVRNYGYTKLLTFLMDKCPKLEISMENSSFCVAIKELDSSINLETEILNMIQQNGGTIDNLSIIHEKLKKKYPNFDLKDYGYSRISSFLRTMDEIVVKDNAVSLKTPAKTPKKKATT